MGAVTYEMLFDLLRRERNRDDLQKLDETFYADVLTYMASKSSGVVGDLSAESEKARIQFHNIKKILKELYDRREKKIVFLALNAVRTGASFADASSFLPEEQLLFSELKTHFSKYRAEIVENVLRGHAPFAGNVPFTPTKEPELVKASVTPVSATSSEDSSSSSSQPDYAPEEDMSAAPVNLPVKSAPADSIKISFVKAVPRFAGGDEQVFGPFSPGDVATLPNKIASVLVKKGRAEEI